MTATTEQTALVRAQDDGTIAIPAEFRASLGITNDTLLRMTLVEGELRIAPVLVEESSRGSQWLRELYDAFAPVRAEILASGVTQEELFADIDAAVADVRTEKHPRLSRESCQIA